MFPVLLEPPSPRWRAAIKRFGELLVVYGHGFLVFGVGKAFGGEIDLAVWAAMFLGVVSHAIACYISARLEP